MRAHEAGIERRGACVARPCIIEFALLHEHVAE